MSTNDELSSATSKASPAEGAQQETKSHSVLEVLAREEAELKRSAGVALQERLAVDAEADAKHAAHMARKYPQTASGAVKRRLDRLMAAPEKTAFIPSASKERAPRRPAEFIRNVWGSSAGVGSGDFHIYRGIRRREYARQEFMELQAERDRLDSEFESARSEKKAKLEDKAVKQQAKNAKKKAKKKRLRQKKGAAGQPTSTACLDGTSEDEGDNDDDADEHDDGGDTGDNQSAPNSVVSQS